MPRATEGIKDEGSDYAAEGTLAHAIGALKLARAFTPMSAAEFKKQLKALQKDPRYNPEMDGFTDEYLDLVKSIAYAHEEKAHVAIERRLDYGAYVPDGFGTGDCIVVGEGVLNITDFKYGKGVFVEAVGNVQMRLYALGAYQLYRMLYPIKTVTMTICQPRLGNIASDTITLDELLAWAEKIRTPAQIAYTGFGSRFVPGSHCQFCALAATCRERTGENMAVIRGAAVDGHLPLPPYITDEETGQILTELAVLDVKHWITKLERHTTDVILNGASIPGWKVVAGRGDRAFMDQDKAFTAIESTGTPHAMLFDTVPKSVAAIETMLGKKAFRETVEPFVVKQQGKPTLAPETDRRDPYKRPTAVEDFGPSQSDKPISGKPINTKEG